MASNQVSIGTINTDYGKGISDALTGFSTLANDAYKTKMAEEVLRKEDIQRGILNQRANAAEARAKVQQGLLLGADADRQAKATKEQFTNNILAEAMTIGDSTKRAEFLKGKMKTDGGFLFDNSTLGIAGSILNPAKKDSPYDIELAKQKAKSAYTTDTYHKVDKYGNVTKAKFRLGDTAIKDGGWVLGDYTPASKGRSGTGKDGTYKYNSKNVNDNYDELGANLLKMVKTAGLNNNDGSVWNWADNNSAEIAREQMSKVVNKYRGKLPANEVAAGIDSVLGSSGAVNPNGTFDTGKFEEGMEAWAGRKLDDLGTGVTPKNDKLLGGSTTNNSTTGGSTTTGSVLDAYTGTAAADNTASTGSGLAVPPANTVNLDTISSNLSGMPMLPPDVNATSQFLNEVALRQGDTPLIDQGVGPITPVKTLDRSVLGNVVGNNIKTADNTRRLKATDKIFNRDVDADRALKIRQAEAAARQRKRNGDYTDREKAELDRKLVVEGQRSQDNQNAILGRLEEGKKRLEGWAKSKEGSKAMERVKKITDGKSIYKDAKEAGFSKVDDYVASRRYEPEFRLGVWDKFMNNRADGKWYSDMSKTERAIVEGILDKGTAGDKILNTKKGSQGFNDIRKQLMMDIQNTMR